MVPFDVTAERERLRLAADCASCFGLCCVAHGFKASATFAFDKLPGRPCPNLLDDFGCTIHRTLRQQGFGGCRSYTCYGAGQKVSQERFGGVDWRQAPETAGLMFQALPMVRQLNELMWFVTEALDRCPRGADHVKLLGLLAATERLGAASPDEMSWSDVDRHCLAGETLLGEVSATVRATAMSEEDERLRARSAPGDRAGELPLELNRRGGNAHHADFQKVNERVTDLPRADLRGADLPGADLRGTNLWGADLTGANLIGADLRWADLMGANFGRANLADADFTGAIFLTQSQLELADGNTRTILSPPLTAPTHWSAA